MAEAICAALNEKWLNVSAKCYATGSQTSNIFPLALGIVPETSRRGILNSLVDDILEKRHGHLHVGVVGLTAVMDAFVDLGRGDVLYRVST